MLGRNTENIVRPFDTPNFWNGLASFSLLLRSGNSYARSQDHALPVGNEVFFQSFDEFSAVGLFCVGLAITWTVRFLLGSVKQERMRSLRRQAALDAYDTKSAQLQLVHKNRASGKLADAGASTSNARFGRVQAVKTNVFGLTENSQATFKISYASHSANARNREDSEDYCDNRTDDRSAACYD